MAKFYYAVKKGAKPGVYDSWDDCKAQVTGFKGAIYKKFANKADAEAFVTDGGSVSSQKSDEISEDELIAYVDGSFNPKTKVIGYGVVIIDHEGRIFENMGSEEGGSLIDQRNVAGEIFGSVRAIKIALGQKKKRIYIHYDYMGIECWAKGSWKTNIDLTKNYKAFFDSIKNDIEVVFIKVKAHSNDKYNDLADALAKKACGVK